MKKAFFLIVIVSILFSCRDKKTGDAIKEPGLSAVVPVKDSTDYSKVDDASAILSKKEIPILCYHQLREWRPSDSKRAKDYIVPVNAFRAQMQLLADSGYQTILPEDLYDYLLRGKPLPEKPVMLTFDDTDLSQFDIGGPELKKHGFKGVFFIMTVSIGRRGYMTRDHIKALSDEGHTIGSHTWDHHNVKLFTESDWPVQVDKPTRQLEAITGKPVEYFAYPFGLWNTNAIPELKKRKFKSAFQLTDKRDQDDPLFTIRRMIVPGEWTAQKMDKWMRVNFR